MRHPVIGVFNNTQDLWLEAIPRAYHNNEWHDTDMWLYTNTEWRQVGNAGTLMIPFITVDGEYFYTSDGKMFLVRAHK